MGIGQQASYYSSDPRVSLIEVRVPINRWCSVHPLHVALGNGLLILLLGRTYKKSLSLQSYFWGLLL